jgi:hypothetical protein
MIQKIRFLNSDSVPPPNQADLLDWFKQHKQEYSLPLVYDLRQVYLGRSISSQKVSQLVSELNGQKPKLNEKLIDSVTRSLSLPQKFIQVSSVELSRQFGQSFAEALNQAIVGSWTGPIVSGFGQHVVRIDAKQVPTQASLDDPRIRKRVENDWRTAKLSEIEERTLNTMLERYDVVIQDQ